MEKIGNFLYSVYNWVWTDFLKTDLFIVAAFFVVPLPFALVGCLLKYFFGSECFFVAYYPGIVFALVILVCAVWCGIGSFRKPNWDGEWFWNGAAIGFMLGCEILFVMGIEWIVLEPVIFN